MLLCVLPPPRRSKRWARVSDNPKMKAAVTLLVPIGARCNHPEYQRASDASEAPDRASGTMDACTAAEEEDCLMVDVSPKSPPPSACPPRRSRTATCAGDNADIATFRANLGGAEEAVTNPRADVVANPNKSNTAKWKVVRRRWWVRIVVMTTSTRKTREAGGMRG